MGTFDYAMALVSIIVGLGLTHILDALGAAVHRLKGHGAPIRFDLIYLLWIGFVLIWLVSFWWWEFKFKTIDIQWTFGVYLFVICYALVLFLLAVVLVPHHMDGVEDTYEYFMSGRRWFFGVLLVANFVDIIDSLLKGASWAMRPASIGNWIFYATACVVGVLAKRRPVQLTLAIAMFLFQMTYTWDVVEILGLW